MERQKSKKKPSSFSEAEIKEITNLCSTFEYDEMTFEAWTNVETNLNLVIPVKLSKQEADEGTSKQISWSRVIESTKNGGINHRERQRVVRLIDFPPKIKAGWSLHFEGLGDVRDERQGCVQIIVRIV